MDLLKRCTALRGLEEGMWCKEHHSQARDFLQDCSQPVLLIYIDPQSRELAVSSSLPPFQLDQIAFFVKEKNVLVTSQNFHQVVQMGTVRGNLVDTLLHVMLGLYAPAFFENKTWPNSILPQGMGKRKYIC